MRRAPILFAWLAAVALMVALLAVTGAFHLTAVIVVLVVAIVVGFVVAVRSR